MIYRVIALRIPHRLSYVCLSLPPSSRQGAHLCCYWRHGLKSARRVRNPLLLDEGAIEMRNIPKGIGVGVGGLRSGLCAIAPSMSMAYLAGLSSLDLRTSAPTICDKNTSSTQRSAIQQQKFDGIYERNSKVWYVIA